MTGKKRIAALLTAAAIGFGPTGCGSDGPATYPVSGKVELPGGDLAALAGSTVEAALEADPTVRAAGTIRPDGGFALESLLAGAMRPGAKEGGYRVRVVLADDDPKARKQATKAVAARFLKFETSGLGFRVPAAEDVVLKLSPR